MAAPAVCCADKEDSPGVAHFRPLSLCRRPPPDSPSPAVPFSPGFWVPVGVPGQMSVATLGTRQAQALSETGGVPASFGGDLPCLGPPAAPPGGVRLPTSRVRLAPRPIWASPVGPQVWAFARILRFLSRSHPLFDTATRLSVLPRGLEPFFPINELSWRTLSLPSAFPVNRPRSAAWGNLREGNAVLS